MSKKTLLHDDEIKRLETMKKYENELYSKGHNYIAGIDEVGRGPIAGPVAASAVILPSNFMLEGVNDSKKLTEKKRWELASEIKKQALAWSVHFIYPPYLDEINILNSTIEAMKNAIFNLSITPEYLLIDAVKLSDINIKQKSIIKGDANSISIACASIIAKVERDSMMQAYDEMYPGYGFKSHKGYATKEHIEALFKKGPTPIHRVSFEPVKSLVSGGKNVKQPGLF